ncbi:Gamma-glutamyl cyclotransferase, AIG2-like [Nocardia amikacinitolerans]|uniref:Putative gamma-glutamylcyclotransferase n=1 Tax=Nocardia amikacinitolerans TaxID=756689 RepID=A0A285LWY2_9NOCA|nr:gamma-glutamylcyclotransferase family protein [Nocardia amikacinitolerans]SNY89422.1 Gamma-glutamyl cyclotransferase, AIG2-like [Nocardia amikacinitolerans]
MDVIGNGPGGRLARVSTTEHALFVYGTLQFPEVLHQLIGRCPDLSPAELTGWRAAALPGRLYPGLVADARATVRGALLSGLSAGEWAVLDAFEDDEYDLRPVDFDATVRADTGVRSSRHRPEDPDLTASARYAPGAVWTYVWTADVTPRDWRAEEFAAEHLSAFATSCAGWRQTLDPVAIPRRPVV